MSRTITRRIVAGLCAATMTLGLAACGSDEDTKASTGSSDSSGIDQAKATVAKYDETPKFEIKPLSSKPEAGKVIGQVNCNVPSCSPGTMEPPVEALGWKLDLHEFDLSKGPQDFVRAFNQALDAKPDFLSVTFVFPEDVVADQLKRAKAEGIPVVAVGGTDPTNVTAIVQGEVPFEEAGNLVADIALADKNGPVKAVIPVDPTIPILGSIAAGIEKGITKNGAGSKVEQVKLNIAQPQATNVSAVINYLKRNPDTEYILFPGTVFYTGMYQGLEAAGLADKVKIVLSYPFPTDLKAIEDGETLAVVAGESTHQWRQIDLLARLSIGEDIENKTPSNAFRIVTKDNVTPESIDPPDFMEVFKAAWGV